jgi:hypothetical protein
MWVELSPGNFLNLEGLTVVRFGTGDGQPEATVTCGPTTLHYVAAEALALRAALQAACSGGTGRPGK